MSWSLSWFRWNPKGILFLCTISLNTLKSCQNRNQCQGLKQERHTKVEVKEQLFVVRRSIIVNETRQAAVL